MSRHDTYQVAVNGMALDVTITMAGEDDYFIDRIEPANSCLNLWPLISGSDIEERIRDLIDEKIRAEGPVACAAQARVDERIDEMRGVV